MVKLIEENATLQLSGGLKKTKIDDEEKMKLIQQKMEEMKNQIAENEDKITLKLREVEEKKKQQEAMVNGMAEDMVKPTKKAKKVKKEKKQLKLILKKI